MSYETVPGHIWNVAGFSANGAHTGLKRKRKDFTIIKSDVVCSAAAVFTKNKLIAAPLIVDKDHLQDGCAQAIISNSGSANACTGEQGIEDAYKMCELASSELLCKKEDVLVLSTGVIGTLLDMEKIKDSITHVSSILGSEKGTEAAEGIMTTDTMVKEVLVKTDINGVPVTLGAIAKGSGMIHPNMATMLSFIVTDAKIASGALQRALSASVEKTYNMISVDGDTSTNDTVAILANGVAKNDEIIEGTKEYDMFCEALDALNEMLAKMIVSDGEGATKVFEVQVIGAPTSEVAKKVGKSVVSSSLVKAAVYGGDPNWGRVMCAAGYSGADVDVPASQLTLKVDEEKIVLFDNGMPTDYSEQTAKELMEEKYITFILDLKKGNESIKAWGCDLTNEYVNINAHYRT